MIIWTRFINKLNQLAHRHDQAESLDFMQSDKVRYFRCSCGEVWFK